MEPLLLVALGGNLTSTEGSPANTLRAALAALVDRGATIRAASPFYHTPAFPAGSGPDYVNAAAWISANWTPEQALFHLHAIEAAFGRERVQRWGQRTLDLDLLAYDQRVLPDRQTFDKWRSLPVADQIGHAPDELVLPHPRMQDRAFVLVPLADVAPGWMHPVIGKTVAEMLAALPQADIASVRAAD